MPFLLKEVQFFYKIRTCLSNYTGRIFSGVLHVYYPKNHYICKTYHKIHDHVLKKVLSITYQTHEQYELTDIELS